MSSSVRKEEIAHFSKDAGRWWDPEGPFAPLHRLNPARMGHIRAEICRHYELDQASLKPFDGFSVLDVGCGGGLVAEPLARLGATVTGIDADETAIGVARMHAVQVGLNIDYQAVAAEDITEAYDVVLALEIIEHVANPAEFVKTCARLVKPGGLVIFSTLNRNPKSFLLGVVAAEYILRWVPRGTHNWRQFIKPSELAKAARAAGLEPATISGLMFNPLKGEFEISATDIDVNYFMSARKA